MPHLSTPLSKNFTLEEFLRSDTAERDERLKQEQENPPPEVIESLRYLVDAALQPIRSDLGFPIRITSGYRCPTVNKLVGGSGTSQHCKGEAADSRLSPRFLNDRKAATLRKEIRLNVQELTGNKLKSHVSENFFLFAYICLHLEELDVDQVIHEYGEGFGHPAWIHISASKRRDKRQILCVGRYTDGYYLKPTLKEALAYGT
jgi:hypothetical protein